MSNKDLISQFIIAYAEIKSKPNAKELIEILSLKIDEIPQL